MSEGDGSHRENWGGAGMLKEEVVIRLTYTEDGSDRRPREDH